MRILIKRNIRLYFSDKASVFLSMLGALIALILVFLFLKAQIVDSMVADSNGLIPARQAGQLLDTWLIASACVIASCTTGLGALNWFVQDRQSAAWRDFLVSPLPRWAITGGYLGCATLVSMLSSSLIYLAGTVYCLAVKIPLAWANILAGWGALLLSCLGFTAAMGFIVSWLRTSGAFTGVSVIVGVMFGFLSQTYATPSALPPRVDDVLAALPFAQAAALVRAPYTASVLASLPQSVSEASAGQLGINLSIGASTLSPVVFVLVLAAMAVVGSLLAWQVIAHTVKG